LRAETIGQSPAVWLSNPAKPDANDHHWLFKPVEIHANGERQGGDWAEKVVAEIARELQIPTAEIELAVRDGVAGSISRNVKPEFWDMWSGRLWLDADPAVGYSSALATKSKRIRGSSVGYDLPSISTVLNAVGPVSGFEFTKDMTGFQVFVGYLLLDALVANRDRHEDNWAVVVPAVGDFEPRMSALFDNAGSLGYQLNDDGRHRILNEDGGLARWAARGTAWRFHSPTAATPVSLVELAIQALQMSGNGADLPWLSRIESLSSEALDSILDRMPEMSEAARIFAREIVLMNLERIRDGYRNVAA
jgi:hypothetical protein